MSEDTQQPPHASGQIDSALAAPGGGFEQQADGDRRSSRPAWADWSAVDIGERLFELRDYTPIPLILLTLYVAEPTVGAAVLGTVIAMLGELIRVYSVAFIGSVSRTRNVETAGAALITGGPFAFVRNPLYVGNFLITMGLAVFSAKGWLVFVAAALFAFQYYCIVKHEERLLVSRFGSAYEDFMATVPPWIPAKWPTLETIEWPTTFSPALRSERRTLLTIVVLVTLLTLKGGSPAPHMPY